MSGKLSGKITIAKFENGYITAKEYNETIHGGKTYCPFCDPPRKVTCVLNDFYRVFPGQRHNCGKQPAIYLNADWNGRKITETLKNSDGEIEITIDINKMDSIIKTGIESESMNPATDGDIEKLKYMRYKEYKEVFRDVVRSVLQMKRLLENNPYEKLEHINFKFKAGNENLSINEVVKLVDELSFLDSGKYRFVIFKVENVAPWKGKVYINSYITNGIRVSATICPSNKNTNINKFVKSLDQYKDKIVIAYGHVTYSQKKRQYYLNLLSDLNIREIIDKSIVILFANKMLEQFKIPNKKTFSQNEEIIIEKPKQIEKLEILKQETASHNEEIAKTIPNEEITMREPRHINNDLSNPPKQTPNIDYRSAINEEEIRNNQPGVSIHKQYIEDKTKINDVRGGFLKRLTNKLLYMFRRSP